MSSMPSITTKGKHVPSGTYTPTALATCKLRLSSCPVRSDGLMRYTQYVILKSKSSRELRANLLFMTPQTARTNSKLVS